MLQQWTLNDFQSSMFSWLGNFCSNFSGAWEYISSRRNKSIYRESERLWVRIPAKTSYIFEVFSFWEAKSFELLIIVLRENSHCTVFVSFYFRSFFRRVITYFLLQPQLVKAFFFMCILLLHMSSSTNFAYLYWFCAKLLHAKMLAFYSTHSPLFTSFTDEC